MTYVMSCIGWARNSVLSGTVSMRKAATVSLSFHFIYSQKLQLFLENNSNTVVFISNKQCQSSLVN